MTTLRLTLKTSAQQWYCTKCRRPLTSVPCPHCSGREVYSEPQTVSLRAGKEMGWPDGARMDWVRLVDGDPEIVTANLALDWIGAAGGGVAVAYNHEHSEPWRGCDAGEHPTTEEDEDRLQEWADTFCAEVNKVLADVAALTPFADMHQHEIEWRRLRAEVLLNLGQRMTENDDASSAEEFLGRYVREVIVEAVERVCQRRAAAEYEREGGRLETEPRAGNEAWKPKVPAEVLASLVLCDYCRKPVSEACDKTKCTAPEPLMPAGGFCSDPDCTGRCSRAPSGVLGREPAIPHGCEEECCLPK